MARFQYKGINRSGQAVQGKIDAESAATASNMLAERGLFVDEIASMEAEGEGAVKPYRKRSSRLRLSVKDRVGFLRQLAIALGAKLSLLTALGVVGQQNPRPAVKQLVSELTEIIKSGKSLSFGLSQYPASFDRLHWSMVAVGETTGTLGESMGQLAQLDEAEYEAKSEITTAALYPAFVLALGVVSSAIVVTWVLPQILSTLVAEAETLPWPTRVIMAISEWLSVNGLWFFIILVLGGWLFKKWKQTPIGRYFWDGITLKFWIYGSVKRRWAVSRFARTLGTLSRGGINIIDSLQIVRNTLGNEVLAREVDQMVRKVQTGTALAESLRQSGKFPPLLVQIVSVGEETGQLDQQLLSAADAFERETKVAIRRFMAIFPAVLILLLALVIGFIVAATLLPIVQIETAIPGL
jgi:type II secretory pathway component PulF